MPEATTVEEVKGAISAPWSRRFVVLVCVVVCLIFVGGSSAIVWGVFVNGSTNPTNAAFDSTAQLHIAVDVYLWNNTNETEVALMYGVLPKSSSGK